MNSKISELYKTEDIEKLNRDNFKAFMDAISRPGELRKVSPLFNSYILGAASVFLYPESTFFENCEDDFLTLELITGAKRKSVETTDYLFLERPDSALIEKSREGTHESPELSATFFIKKDSFAIGTDCRISGPGIDGQKNMTLPLDEEFINVLLNKNSRFPLGVDVFLISNQGEVIGIPRTLKIEVL